MGPPKKTLSKQLKPKLLLKPGKTKEPFMKLQKEDVKKHVVALKNADVIQKKHKYIMPSKYVTQSIVKCSLDSLQNLAAHSKKKNAIFDDETPIFMEINCIKIQSKKGNIRFELPHSTVPSTGEVCLVTPDMKKGKKVDHEPTIDHWEEVLRNAGVTKVKTVLPMRQLRVEYDQFELKRRLLTQHDFIMVDTRVINHVSHILGQMFFKKHNMLIPVRMNEKDVKKSIEKGLRTVMLRLGEGPTSTVVVGHSGMAQNELLENIMSLVQQLKDKYPGREANIRTIALKFPLSMSLPLYVTLRSANTVDPPKLKQNRPKHFEVVEDELTTILDGTVRVAPDGTVCIKKSKTAPSNIEKDDSEVDEEKEQDSDME